MDPVSSSKMKVAAWEVEPRRIDPGKNRRFDIEAVLSRLHPCLSLSFDKSTDCETDTSLGVNEVACFRAGRGGTWTRG